MRQVLKWTLAIAMCLALLVPSAWGRSKDYGETAVPWSDESAIGEAASVPSDTVIVVFETVGGVVIPIIIDVSLAPSDTQTSATSVSEE